VYVYIYIYTHTHNRIINKVCLSTYTFYKSLYLWHNFLNSLVFKTFYVSLKIKFSFFVHRNKKNYCSCTNNGKNIYIYLFFAKQCLFISTESFACLFVQQNKAILVTKLCGHALYGIARMEFQTLTQFHFLPWRLHWCFH
jgi:hypothetical protein